RRQRKGVPRRSIASSRHSRLALRLPAHRQHARGRAAGRDELQRAEHERALTRRLAGDLVEAGAVLDEFPAALQAELVRIPAAAERIVGGPAAAMAGIDRELVGHEPGDTDVLL